MRVKKAGSQGNHDNSQLSPALEAQAKMPLTEGGVAARTWQREFSGYAKV
jgi:hypothetical protein